MGALDGAFGRSSSAVQAVFGVLIKENGFIVVARLPVGQTHQRGDEGHFQANHVYLALQDVHTRPEVLEFLRRGPGDCGVRYAKHDR